MDGFAIEIEGSRIEIYEFDTSITAGKTALDRLEKDGFMENGILRNKNLALMKKTKHPEWNKIKKVFQAM